MGKREGGGRGWVEAGKGGETGTSVIMSTTKIRLKKENHKEESKINQIYKFKFFKGY